MNKRALRRLRESGPVIILEQLEDRIVLDGAIDDASNRADFSSAQVSEDHGVTESHVSEDLAAESLTEDSLVL